MNMYHWIDAVFLASVWAGFFAVLATWTVWCLYCNDCTLRDRTRLIENCPKSHNDLLANREFWNGPQGWDDVEYNDHYRARKWFRDPKKLYNLVVQACWDKPWVPEAERPKPVKLVEDTREYLKYISELESVK